MNPELAPAIVYNPRSGDGKSPAIIAGTLHKFLGNSAEVFLFHDVLKNPQNLAGKNVIVIGGDGTHGTVAVLHQKVSQYGWLLPADGGTAGIIPESLGWGSKIGEKPDVYAQRLARDLQADRYAQIHIPLGMRRSFHADADNSSYVQQEIFFWNVAVGKPLASGLRAMEKKRASTSKVQRMGTLFETYCRELKRARPQSIIIAGDRRTVVEAHVHKDPFKNIQLLSLPHPGQDLLMTIPHERRPEVVQRVLMDIALLTLRLPPIAHGIDITPIKPHEVVIFERTHEKQTMAGVDSELCELELPVVVQADVPNERGFALLQRR